MQNVDIVIVGGGLAGAGLAAALADSRFSVALVERQAPPALPVVTPGLDARVYALTPASAAFLASVGAWERLEQARLTPIERMRIAGDAGGALAFSAYEACVPRLGWIGEASIMLAALETVLAASEHRGRLVRISPASPIRLEARPEGLEVLLDNGRTLRARLVVAADGRDSWVRQAAGLKADDHPYHASGVVANFACETPHRRTAWQWFRRDGVLAWLPLPGQQLSMVWSTPDVHAAALCALSPEALAAHVAEAGQHRLGKLTCLAPAQALPLRLIRVPQVVASRVALVGDAAHGIHPLSGHGINLGFMDARALAAGLLALPEGGDPGDPALLRRYAAARLTETRLMQETTHALHALFQSRLPGVRFARNLGLSLTNRLPGVKNALLRYAMGEI